MAVLKEEQKKCLDPLMKTTSSKKRRGNRAHMIAMNAQKLEAAPYRPTKIMTDSILTTKPAFSTGDIPHPIFLSKAEALINFVNCQGIMNDGLSEAFSVVFPENHWGHLLKCLRNDVRPFKPYASKHTAVIDGVSTTKTILNVPIKEHWRLPPSRSGVKLSLKALLDLVKDLNIKTIALPLIDYEEGYLTKEIIKEFCEDIFKESGVTIDYYDYSGEQYCNS